MPAIPTIQYAQDFSGTPAAGQVPVYSSFASKFKPVNILRSNRLAVLGDSHVNLNAPTVVSVANSIGDLAWAYLANARAGYPCRIVKVSGHSGFQTNQILNDSGTNWVQTDIIPNTPAACILMIGANDNVNGVTASTAFTNWKSIVNQLKDAGIIVIACLLTPNRNVTAGTMFTQFCEYNARLREYCMDNPGVALCDFSTPMMYGSWATPFERTGSSASPYTAPVGTSSDGVHFNEYGSALAAEPLATILSSLFPAVPFTLNHNFDPGNLLINGLSLGTGGTKDAGMNSNTGNVPDDWHVSGGTNAQAENSKVTRTDIPGHWHQIVLGNSDGAVAAAFRYQSVTTGFSAGDVVYGMAEAQMDSDVTGFSEQNLLLFARNSGGANVGQSWAQWHNTSGGADCTQLRPTMRYRTENFTVPATTTTIQFFCRTVAKTGTFRWGRCELRKVLA